MKWPSWTETHALEEFFSSPAIITLHNHTISFFSSFLLLPGLCLLNRLEDGALSLWQLPPPPSAPFFRPPLPNNGAKSFLIKLQAVLLGNQSLKAVKWICSTWPLIQMNLTDVVLKSAPSLAFLKCYRQRTLSYCRLLLYFTNYLAVIFMRYKREICLK